MSHAVAQYPLDFYRSSIVSKPLLVQSKDKSRVFIGALRDDESLGQLKLISQLPKSGRHEKCSPIAGPTPLQQS